MAKVQRDVVVSPTATAAYAWLAKPDEGQEFSDGKYKVTLVLDPKQEGVSDFIENVRAKSKKAAEAEWEKLPKMYVIVLRMVTILTKKNLQTKL